MRPEINLRRKTMTMTKIGATTAVEAAVRLPHSVPYRPVNSVIPIGAVLASTRVICPSAQA